MIEYRYGQRKADGDKHKYDGETRRALHAYSRERDSAAQRKQPDQRERNGCRYAINNSGGQGQHGWRERTATGAGGLPQLRWLEAFAVW